MPARAVPVAYLDYETTRDTLNARLALIAAGRGIDPTPILYKRMTRPLADEAAALAAEFARSGVGLVIVDSMVSPPAPTALQPTTGGVNPIGRSRVMSAGSSVRIRTFRVRR